MGLRDALARADAILARQAGHEETTAARAAAYRLAARGAPSPEDVETLGGGWVGEEALAMAVCCVLAAADFSDGVLRAVTHSGDSDSTGAICGISLGALWGENDGARSGRFGNDARRGGRLDGAMASAQRARRRSRHPRDPRRIVSRWCEVLAFPLK